MAIDSIRTTPAVSIAQVLSQVAQASAGPAFEVQFNAAQNAAIERYNAEIEKFQNSDFGRGKTAVLRAKTVRLEKNLELAKTFKAYTASSRETVKNILDQLGELRDLADVSTSAEFDAKRTEVLQTIEKLGTANISGLGAPDGLAALKAQAKTDIEAIVLADPPTDAQTTIDDLVQQFSTKLDILELNQDAASSLVRGKDRVLAEVNAKIDAIEIAERKQQIDRVEKLKDDLGRVLGALSLSFEGSKAFADFLAKNTIQTREPDPGSVLNLFA
jgi:hypothetical protein